MQELTTAKGLSSFQIGINDEMSKRMTKLDTFTLKNKIFPSNKKRQLSNSAEKII